MRIFHITSIDGSLNNLVLRSQLQELRLLGLAVLGASRLGVPLLLVLPLASTDSGSAGHGLGAEISAVTLLGGGVDNVLVQFAGRGGGRVGGCVVEFGGLVLLRGLGGHGDGVVVALDADGLGKKGVLVGGSGEGRHGVCIPERWRNRRICASACWSS